MMRRRTFVGSAALVLAGLKLGLLTGCRDQTLEALDASPLAEHAPDALDVIAASLLGAGFAGPRCAARFDSPRERLLEQLRATGAEDMADALAQAIIGDFEQGRIEDLEGWQLSLTECLMLALATQVQSLDGAGVGSEPGLRETTFVDVVNWGPRETVQGQAFNPRPDGRAALWVGTAAQPPGSTRLSIAGHVLDTVVNPDLVTASLSEALTAELVGTPGVHEVALIDVARRQRQPLGTLTVHPKPNPATLADGTSSRVFCEVERWGPTSTVAGSPFNPQPDGSSSFWIRTGCAPADVRVLLGEEELVTLSQPGLVVGRVPNWAALARGRYDLWLVDPASGERLGVGVFEVL